MKIVRRLLVALALVVPGAVWAQAAQEPAPAQVPAGGKQQAEVKGYVLPVVVGVESAERAAAVLVELSNTEPFERTDARKTAELAEQAVNIAHERAEDLSEMKGLSAEAHAEAERAMHRLKEARSTVERIQRQVGLLEGPFRRHEAASVRSEARQLLTELTEAQAAIQRVASLYGISTRLELPEGARGR
jgi:hypothetical protein